MRVAVVGGGIFGCTTAIYAARAGHDVHLYERGPELMQAASLINHFRLHHGYHYPRSAETGRECRAALKLFRGEYSESVIDATAVYAIPREGSRTSAGEFLRFLETEGLPFRAAQGPFNEEALSVAVSVVEGRVVFDKLLASVKKKLVGVKVHLNTPAKRSLRDEFDVIVIAGYAGTNSIALELECATEPFQYEVVEKLVLRVPQEYMSFSMVVMDGDFCALDPVGMWHGHHFLGHVARAIHHRSTGLEPEVPDSLAAYLNAGLIKKPAASKAREMLEDAVRFMPFLKESEHVGSMFTVRTVLPNVDVTDERPTLVDVLDGQVLRVFSGKIGTAVSAAARVVRMLNSSQRAAA